MWRLLINRRVETLEEAAELIDWYRRRWLIEILVLSLSKHFSAFSKAAAGSRLCSGALSAAEVLSTLVIFLIIAWRILHVVTLGRECPDLPCDVVFDTEEWQAAWIVETCPERGALSAAEV